MAGRYDDYLPSDGYQYLSAPRPNRGYHSDDEARQKKKTVYFDHSGPPASGQPTRPLLTSGQPTRPSPPRQFARPVDAQYYSRVPSPPPLRTDNRRFSSQDVRPSRAVSPPVGGSSYLSASGQERLYGIQPPSLRIRDPAGNTKNVSGRHSQSFVPQRQDLGTSFPEVKPPTEKRSWYDRPSSDAGISAMTRPSLAASKKSISSSGTGTLGDKVYRYNELGESEFRLVRVLPARMSKIKCEVVHASISSPPRYIAISYAWGDAGDTRRLELEGADIPVSVSLHGALDAVRQKNEIVTVWVDALCIDQQNRDERTRQVQLMTKIYSKAQSVAIWLGPESDRSAAAAEFIQDVAERAESPNRITKLLSTKSNESDVSATVSLFERDYWKRLWVVQEVFNAKDVTVYCGSSKLPWDIYKEASRVFQRHKGDLDYYFPGNSQGRTYARASQNHFTYSQILAYQGPGSLPDVRSLVHFGEESLLEVMRACRRKLASDAKDKVFGILGLLSEDVRNEFTVDYSLSVKEIYTNVVDFLVWTTGRLDVICESIHYPLHTNTASLPSWVPDWSHIPDTSAMCAMNITPPFWASGGKQAQFLFKDDRRNKLEISGIQIDTISAHGIAVGTLCTLADYLMAFIHWRALLLSYYKADAIECQDIFCRTLCLNQVPRAWAKSTDWVKACYHVFASLIRERLPHLPLDRELERYIDAKVDIKPEARRRFLQEHFGSRMMGRCFYTTKQGLLGLGSGFMAIGDVVVVPYGCNTPVILRPEGCRSEYRYVGDAYLHGYMYGRAVDELRLGDRKEAKFILH
ncbi:heterokaryon incompatibility protein [Colletotrichum truncatum]|uniref:Heterokaryon incompatibility protein n=1 Tax=Colletotrichum truncatum TaxID=5467 RepID=A0ACC3YHJ0_COLTU|nr:heterokaryon incompatibility protein [Colletotrichum truncatum]KAF6784121.1 heterokaryon incompatibility protein [Colletotrichum truncatum]